MCISRAPQTNRDSIALRTAYLNAYRWQNYRHSVPLNARFQTYSNLKIRTGFSNKRLTHSHKAQLLPRFDDSPVSRYTGVEFVYKAHISILRNDAIWTPGEYVSTFAFMACICGRGAISEALLRIVRVTNMLEVSCVWWHWFLMFNFGLRKRCNFKTQRNDIRSYCKPH